MKILKNTFILGLVLKTTFGLASLDPSSSCDAEIQKHLKIVESTNEYFKKLTHLKNEELTSYDAQQFEHMALTRFKHFTTLSIAGCEKQAIRNLVSISDYTSFSKIVLSDFKQRRLMANVINYHQEDFKYFKSIYKVYTSKKTLKKARINLIKENNLDNFKTIEDQLDLNIDETTSMTHLSDLLTTAATSTIAGLAIGLGNLSDKTIWREGHLKENNTAVQYLKERLKPFDLLYESRNYTLTHYTIPGHWGHVAIWMGTKEELIDLGLWEKDFMQPFKEQIEKGKNIVEMRKPGIQFQSLETFINLDEIAVTRINNIESKAEEIFKQLTMNFGKEYDFTFNAQTEDKITCAELVSFSYGDIKWPMSSKLNVVNLRPDDLAVYTINNPDKASFVAYLVGAKDSKGLDILTEEAFRELFNQKI